MVEAEEKPVTAEKKDKKEFVKRLFIDYIPAAAAFLLILITGIINGQSFIKMFPALMSTVIMMFYAHVNRYAVLVGAANSIIYSIGYFQEGLYASVANALFASATMQIITFIRWSKHKYKRSTVIRKMNRRQLVFWSAVLIGMCVASYILFKLLGGTEVFLDSTYFAIGLFSIVLSMFGYMEGTVADMISRFFSITMWLLIFIENPSDITYLFLMLYNTYRSFQTHLNWIRLYKEQQAVKNITE